MLEGGPDVLVISVVVLALDGVDLDAVIAHQVSGRVVLRRQRIRSAERDVGAASLQSDHQVGRLGRDVQAGRQLLPIERPLLGEAFADHAHNGHGTFGPFDAALPGIGEIDVFDVVVYGLSHYFTAFFNSSTLSVRSHEKPPSPSGSRPKCP